MNSVATIDRDRLLRLFLDLVRTDSHSRHEGRVAARLGRELQEIGAEVWVDGAGQVTGSDTGNLLACLPGTVPGAPPILLCAHMDTVVPGEGVAPTVEGDVVRSDGRTVLGGDDKSGCAIICEVARVLQESAIPHGEVEMVFTVCEEVGLLGAKSLDTSRLHARRGLVLDADEPECLFTRAPGADRIRATVRGIEAHAGMCPERGISAIQVAAEAIAAMRLGRIDDETTANIGRIEGGRATNIVPPEVTLAGEVRSHDERKLAVHSRHLRECLEAAASRHHVVLDGREVHAEARVHIEREYEAMRLADDSPAVRLVTQAAAAAGLAVRTASMGGGSDANVLNQRGFEVANLGTGMHEVHTVREWLDVGEMVRAAVIVLETVRLAAARAAP